MEAFMKRSMTLYFCGDTPHEALEHGPEDNLQAAEEHAYEEQTNVWGATTTVEVGNMFYCAGQEEG